MKTSNAEHRTSNIERQVTERAVYGASMSAVPRVSLSSKIVGLLTLKRPEGRAPASRLTIPILRDYDCP